MMSASLVGSGTNDHVLEDCESTPTVSTPLLHSAMPGAQSVHLISNRGRPNIHALLIGINHYQSIPGLEGAVSDAERMFRFLLLEMNTPHTQIVQLLNGQATRGASLAALSHLKENGSIVPGDQILIYIAGHGTQLLDSHGVRVNVLCMSDFSFDDTQQIDGIADFELNLILSEISVRHPQSPVTVIVDACFAAGTTRFVHTVDYKTRFAVPPGGATLTTTFTRPLNYVPDTCSHVLLAACGEDECAFERGGEGFFTTELLRLLPSAVGVGMSFNELVANMHTLHTQHPQCVGDAGDSYVFDPERGPSGINKPLTTRSRLMRAAVHSGRTMRPIDGVFLVLLITAIVVFLVHESHNHYHRQVVETA